MTFCKLLSVLVLIHNTEVSVSIIGGMDAAKGSWPWMVHLDIALNNKSEWRCGGTLLNRHWVLTAAHCLDQLQQPDVHQSMVWIGTHALQKPSNKYMAIDTVILHPHFYSMGNRFANDIALIKLKKEVVFSPHVAPVQLASPDDVFGSSSECWIIGWGQIGNGVPLPKPETLQEVKISLMPQTSCEVERYQTLSWAVLAGDKAGGKDSCSGDCGGPLLCRTAQGFVQVGIRSHGSRGGCGLPDSPGVYTRVSKHLRFINYYIHRVINVDVDVSVPGITFTL